MSESLCDFPMSGLILRRLPIISKTFVTRSLASADRSAPVLNEALRHLPSVRLISESGQDYGIMNGEQALRRARSAGRDIMQVSVSSPPNPTVVRLVDYAAMEEARRKKAYEKRKSEKEKRKIQKREMALKQVRLSPATDSNDKAIKLRQAKHFLKDGYRVRVFMMFRRGHGVLRDAAVKTLIEIATELANFGRLQGIPQGGTIEDIFNPPKSESDPDDPDNEIDSNGELVVKRTPLEVLLYPLPRKERALINDADAMHGSNDDNVTR